MPKGVFTEEVKERSRQRLRDLWKNPEYREKMCKSMSEKAKELWKKEEFREGHRQRLIQRNKTVTYPGDKHYNWKGGRYLGSDGYIHLYYPNHPNKDARGYVVEHRIKMEHKLRRILRKEEVVHHKNSDRKDNSYDNLLLLDSIKEHNRIHEHPRNLSSGRYLSYPEEESRLP